MCLVKANRLENLRNILNFILTKASFVKYITAQFVATKAE
jgi:hypothetical protein